MRYLRVLSIVPFVAAAAASLAFVLLQGGEETKANQAPPNQPSTQGQEFNSIDEASANAGFEFMWPRDLEWSFRATTVTKRQTSPGENIIAQMSFVEVPNVDFTLTMINREAPAAVAGGTPRQIEVLGHDATLDRGDRLNPNLITVSWNDDGKAFQATGFVTDAFTEDDFLALLESIR